MSTTPEIPHDDAIPQLALLLDTEAVTPVLQRSLGAHASISACAIRYVRYKQGRSLLARYEFSIDGSPHGVVALAEPQADLAARASKPENLQLAQKVDGRTPAAMRPSARRRCGGHRLSRRTKESCRWTTGSSS